jgi:hypothetical protein
MQKTGLITLLFIILQVFVQPALAQTRELKGIIRDIHSDEVIPFATVKFSGTFFIKLSDSAGHFKFILRNSWPSDSLLVTYAGFEENHVHIDTAQHSIDIVIKMERKKNITEVVVKSKIGRGLLLWRKIVKFKDNNDRSRFDNYSYELYNKLEIDLNNVNVEKMQRGILPPKPFKFILNNVDTITEPTPILPIYLIENISDYYFQKNPKKTREIIKASKTIGLKNESVSKFLGGMYQNINVYKNFIPIFDREYVSPISNDGDLYYHYKVPDTQYIGGKRFFHLEFFPKRKGESTFQGDAWIEDSSFAVQKMNLQVSPGSNINFIDKLSLVQEYRLLQDSIWFLSKDKFIANFNLTGKNNLNLIGRKTTTYSQVKIDAQSLPETMQADGIDDNRKELVLVADNAMEKTDEFWLKNRHEKLNKTETNFYKMADSLLKIPAFDQYSNWLRFIGTGYKYIGNYEIGPWMNWISGNVYEGLRLRFDLGTNYHFSKKIYLSSYLAYGTQDQKMKGKLEALYMIGKNPRSSIRLLYKKDMDYGQSYYDEIGYDNLFALAFRKNNVPIKLISIEQQKIEYFKEWKNGFSFTTNFQRKIYNPIRNLPGKTDFSVTEDPGNFNNFEINAKVRFAYLERFLQDDFFRTSLGSDYPVVELALTKGMKGVFKSGYSYSKINLSISDYVKIPPAGSFYYSLYAGKIYGKLPYMLLSIAPGNEIYYYNKYAFNLMNRFEYLSDEYAGLNIEHNFGSGVFKIIPQNKILKLRQFWNAKILWGGLSKENTLLNISTKAPFQTLNGKTYLEIGTGVDNIFRFFRIDLVWRFLPKPFPVEGYKKFGLFGSFRFSF